LLPAFVSPAFVTTAAFCTAGYAAAPTPTTIEKTRLSPAAIAFVVVAVTMGPSAATVRPATAGELVYTSPVGSVSLTVIVPAEAAVPSLWIAKPYTAGCPTVNVPVWLFTSARSGTPLMTVGSSARPFVGSLSPGVSAAATFVTPPSAAGPTDTVSVHSRLSPGAIGPGFVAVTTPPALPKAQPAPLPDT